jgi:transposase
MLTPFTEVGMHKKYVVRLSDTERAELRQLVSTGTAAARQLTRARILLLADAGQTDAAITTNLGVGTTTVERIRKLYVETSLERALSDLPRSGKPRKLDGKQEALLVALTCSEPPDQRDGWTMQLLADRLVAIGVVDTISDETVRRILKKTISNPG